MLVSQLTVHGVDNEGMHAVGTFWDTANTNQAYITRGLSFESIAPMVGAVRAFSQAWDVSDDGQVIVGEADLSGMGMPGAPSQAIVWKNDGTWRSRPSRSTFAAQRFASSSSSSEVGIP